MGINGKKSCDLLISNVHIDNFADVLDVAIQDGIILEIGPKI